MGGLTSPDPLVLKSPQPSWKENAKSLPVPATSPKRR